VIDEDYFGNVGVVMFNHADTDFQVAKGDRIAQLICERIFYPSLEQVKELSLHSLVNLSQYNLVKNKEAADVNLMLTTRSNSKNNEDTNKIIPIVCGVVIDGNEKKKFSSYERRLP